MPSASDTSSYVIEQIRLDPYCFFDRHFLDHEDKVKGKGGRG
jgi:hypothetical protein